jgi:hypothetical protein
MCRNFFVKFSFVPLNTSFHLNEKYVRVFGAGCVMTWNFVTTPIESAAPRIAQNKSLLFFSEALTSVPLAKTTSAAVIVSREIPQLRLV